MDNCDLPDPDNNQLFHRGISVLCQNYVFCVLFTLCPLHTVTLKPVHQTGARYLHSLILLFFRCWAEWHRHYENNMKYFEVFHFVYSLI